MGPPSSRPQAPCLPGARCGAASVLARLRALMPVRSRALLKLRQACRLPNAYTANTLHDIAGVVHGCAQGFLEQPTHPSN